jgi:NADH-quinone oxidoreductase subunit K
MITLTHFVILATVLFSIGFLGLTIRRNLLIVFMCIEVMLNAANLLFVAFARYHGQLDGQVVAFFVMAVAASEAAVGLAIVITLYRNRQTVKTSDWRILNG